MVRPGKYFQFPLQKCTTREQEGEKEGEGERERQHRQRIALFSSIMKIKFFISMHSHWADRAGHGRTETDRSGQRREGQTDGQSEPCVEEPALLGLPMNAAERLLHIIAKLS